MNKYTITTDNEDVFSIYATSKKDARRIINKMVNVFRPRTAKIELIKAEVVR